MVTEKEKRKIFTAKSLAYSGLLAALLVGGKYALSFIPNVEIVSPLIILTSVFFGLNVSLPAVIAFCLIDTVVYGFYPTVFLQYMVHWPSLAILSYVVSRKSKELFRLIAVNFILSIAFWIGTPVVNVIFRFSLFWSTVVSGIPFFIAQAVSSLAFLIALYKPFAALSRRMV